MKTYKAILFHPEGDFVTDFENNTIEEVWESVNNMGSRWFFYPLVFVIKNKTIVDCPEGFPNFKRKRIKTLQKFLETAWEDRADKICNVLNDGGPLWYIY